MSKRRRRAGKKFPYHDLNASIEVLEKIKQGGVDKLETSILAGVLGHKTEKTSAFILKVNSAKHFGLITESKEKEGEKELKFYCISELGKKIVTPIGTAEKEEAIRQAFFNFDLWKTIYEKYMENKKLPERSTLENVLQREYGVSPVSKSIAYRVLVNSGKEAGLFDETEEGILYTDFEEKIEKEEGEEEEKEEKAKKEREFKVKEEIKLLPLSTNINVTINVDTKDETSVKNFITILNALAGLRSTKQQQ